MSLSIWCYVLGVLAMLGGGAVLLRPAQAEAGLHRFPRNQLAAFVLSAVAWIWAGYAIYSMGLDFMRTYQKFIPVVALVCIPLTWYWMSNLLACRAVGGLLMLFPYELLHVARVHTSPWRLVLVVFAYLCIVGGMITMLYPWRLRQLLHWLCTRPQLLRVLAVVSVIFGVSLLILGALVLR